MPTVRELINAQTRDPGRGSFMVNPATVKEPNGQPMYYNGSPVFRSCSHLQGESLIAHPDSYMFTLTEGK